MRGTARRLVAVGVASGAVALASGCSGAGPAPQLGAGAGQITSTATTPASGADARPGHVDGAVMAERVRSVMAGSGSARFALASSTTSGQDAAGVLNFAGSTIKVSLTFSSGSDRLRVIAVPGVLYADVGEVVQGKHWLKVEAGATDPLSSAMAPLLSYMTNSADISSQAGSWTSAAGFSSAGRTTIGGVAVTEYDATIPLAAVRDNLPAQFRAVMQKDITGDSHLQLWLDGQGRPVQLVTSGSYAGKPDRVTVTYSDWGSAPDVVPPTGERRHPRVRLVRARSLDRPARRRVRRYLTKDPALDRPLHPPVIWGAQHAPWPGRPDHCHGAARDRRPRRLLGQRLFGSRRLDSPSTASTVSSANAAALVARVSSASAALKSAHIVVTTSTAGKESSFTGDVGYDPIRLAMTIGLDGQTLEERIIGDYAYLKLPSGTTAKPWVKVNFAQVAKSMGLDLSSSINNANPAQAVQLLEKSADLKNLGPATVAGVRTTHLSGTVDVAKAYASLSGPAKAQYETLVRRLGLKDEHIDLYVNSQQIPIKVVQSFTAKTGATTVTVLLSKLNQPVSVTAPPASQVGALP